MLSVILATRNPYEAKEEFLKAGWKLSFQTPENSDDRLVIVSLGDSRVMLGIDTPEFLPEDATRFKGAGIDIYVELDDSIDIGRVFQNHSAAGLATDRLEQKPSGVNAFHAKICGYSFFFAGK